MSSPPMPRASPTRISRESIHWLAEDVHAFLKDSCISRPNPEFAPALKMVWNLVIDPFFDGSPAGNSSHGELLENYTNKSHIMAPLLPNGALAVKVLDLCSAIAYVLSTLVEHIPSKKYLTLAGAFTQFCRLANIHQRPETVHIFWPTGRNPIILINNASIHILDQQQSYNPASSYRTVTLDYILSSPSLCAHRVTRMPGCDCSQLIPAIWSFSDGQPLQFFSATFTKLSTSLKRYKQEGGRSISLKAAAMPACDTCRVFMSNIGVSYEDLGVDEFKIDELSSSHSDDSVRRRSSVSGGNVSPTARTHYAAANPASSGHSRISYSPPETRAPIEHARPRGYPRTTIPGITYPIPPSSPQDPYPYNHMYQTPPAPQIPAQQPHMIAYHANAQPSLPYGTYPMRQEVYTHGGYGQGYDPYRAQSVPPPATMYTYPQRYPMSLQRPKQPKAHHFNSDIDDGGVPVGVLIQT